MSTNLSLYFASLSAFYEAAGSKDEKLFWQVLDYIEREILFVWKIENTKNFTIVL